MPNQKYFEDKLILLNEQLNICSLQNYADIEQDFYTIGSILNNYYNINIPVFNNDNNIYQKFQNNISSSNYLLGEFKKEYPFLLLFNTKPFKQHKYHNISLSPNQILKIIQEFFHDKSYFNSKINYLLTNSNSINFFTHTEPISATYHLISTNENYIFSQLTPNILSITTLSHELAHATSLLLNNNRFTNPNNIIFKEVESLFIELLACDFVDSYFSINDGLNRKKELYNLIREDAINALKKKEILNYYEYIQFLSPKDQLKYLHTINKSYTSKYLLQIFNTKITSDFLYTISFLIAIELYYAYQDNPKYTLDILKNLIIYEEQDYYSYLNSLDIHIGYHTNKLIKTLNK